MLEMLKEKIQERKFHNWTKGRFWVELCFEGQRVEATFMRDDDEKMGTCVPRDKLPELLILVDEWTA